MIFWLRSLWGDMVLDFNKAEPLLKTLRPWFKFLKIHLIVMETLLLVYNWEITWFSSHITTYMLESLVMLHGKGVTKRAYLYLFSAKNISVWMCIQISVWSKHRLLS